MVWEGLNRCPIKLKSSPEDAAHNNVRLCYIYTIYIDLFLSVDQNKKSLFN